MLGVGDPGFVPRLAGIARDKGVSSYIGDGQNRWPAVHRRDAARLYCLALDRPEAGPFHAVAEEGVALKDIAEVNRPRFARYLSAIDNGYQRGAHEQQALPGRIQT